MAVLIKAMQMPRACRPCKLYIPPTLNEQGKCFLTQRTMESKAAAKMRHPDCPLIEVMRKNFTKEEEE